MPTTIAYSRVSTAEQGRSGLGLDAQRAAVDDEARRRGWAVVEHVVDEAVSGSVSPEDRPALGPVLARLRRGDRLAVSRLDRLGRSALDVLRLADDLERRGVILLALDLGLDTGSPIGRFVLGVLASLAQMERDIIGERTRDALAAKKRAGARLGGPVRLPQDVRERIVEMRAVGWTLQAIADGLTTEGVPTAQGGARWYPSTVADVLRSVELDRVGHDVQLLALESDLSPNCVEGRPAVLNRATGE